MTVFYFRHWWPTLDSSGRFLILGRHQCPIFYHGHQCATFLGCASYIVEGEVTSFGDERLSE